MMGAAMPESHVALEAGARVQLPLAGLSHRRERERGGGGGKVVVGEVVERERRERRPVERYSLRVND
jgi:hypothetical protein